MLETNYFYFSNKQNIYLFRFIKTSYVWWKFDQITSNAFVQFPIISEDLLAVSITNAAQATGFMLEASMNWWNFSTFNFYGFTRFNMSWQRFYLNVSVTTQNENLMFDIPWIFVFI